MNNINNMNEVCYIDYLDCNTSDKDNPILNPQEFETEEEELIVNEEYIHLMELQKELKIKL